MRDTPSHILIVDDDPSIREALATALQGTYVVHSAATGQEACALLRNHPIATIEVVGLYVWMVQYREEGLQATIGNGLAVDAELWAMILRTLERLFGRPDRALPAHGGYVVMEDLIWVRR